MLSMRKTFVGAFVALFCVTSVALAAGQAAPAKDAKAPKSMVAPASVDLNSASETDLEALPGVGPATAKKIIAGRPYTAIADLAKAGVSKSTIEKITPLVKIGPAPAAPASAPKSAPASTPAASAPASTPMSAPASTPSATSKTTTSAASSTTAQTPPSPGMVWVNLNTKVYHKEGDRYYGNTKNGKWMTEDDAIKAGYRESKQGAAKKKTTGTS